MVSFDLYVHIHVDPPIKGWTVQVYWRSPDPSLEPPYTWVGPIPKTTDETGEAYFLMGVSYTSPEYYPIPIRVVIPEQTYPGSAYHTYGGLTFGRYEGPEWKVVGYSDFHKYITIQPIAGREAEIVVKGEATGGYPSPDMSLELLVDESILASRSIPGASIGTPYELSGVIDASGRHKVQGGMVLSNPLAALDKVTDPMYVDIVTPVSAEYTLNPNWDTDVDADQDPDSTVKDRDDVEIFIRNKTYHDWGLLRFNLAGIYGITAAEFGAYCYDSSGIGSGEDTLLISSNPWPNSFRFGDRPSTIGTVGQAYADAGKWFKTSDSRLVSYLQSRECQQAYFQLYCVKLSGENNSLSYYTKEGTNKPYLKLTYKKYA